MRYIGLVCLVSHWPSDENDCTNARRKWSWTSSPAPPLQWPSPAGRQEEISTQPRLLRVKGQSRAVDKVAADAQINVLHPKHAWPLTLWVEQLKHQ